MILGSAGKRLCKGILFLGNYFGLKKQRKTSMVETASKVN
jgi:hypothetical protein